MPHVPPNHPVPLFLGRSLPVHLVSELRQIVASEFVARLSCATQYYTPEVADYYGTPCETILSPIVEGKPVVVEIEAWSDAVLRLRIAPQDALPPEPTPMVVGKPSAPVHWRVTEQAGRAAIETALVRVEVVHEPFQLRFVERSTARLLWSTRPLDLECLRRPENQWNPAENRWLFVHRYAYPLGFADHGDERYAFLSGSLHHSEHIYGFGEDYGRVDKRQVRKRLWNVEAFSNASPGAYKNIPFFMSTAGYGLFINSSNAITVHVGDLEHTALSIIVDDTTALDLFWIYGPQLRDILPRYTAITGTPALPPKWSFGLWMGRISYNRQEQVEGVAAELRRRRIPCDVIHIDTDWYEHDWQCDLEFGKSKFPDPAGMIQRLREQGFRVCLWQWPNLTIYTSLFREAQERGFLALRSNGHPYLFPGFAGEAGFIDYSNSEAVAWIQEKFRKLFALGVAAIKVDFGEGASPEARYRNGSSEAMHNRYALLYNKAVFEVTESFYGKGNAVIWARSAWAGSQRYPVHWSGDGLARYEDLACVVRAMLSFGLSGFPFYSHDIGGFSGLPDPALYVRWAQLGLFSSHARCHGVPPREPWAYGEEAERIFRQYDELRYRLMPYIYSEAVACTQTSLPFARHLVLEWQDDPVAAFIEDAYLFGRYFLVAPILDETNRRRVYLPRGTWFDYWTKQQIEGGCWLEVEAPLDVLPLYVRAGAIVPYAPLMQHTEEKPWDLLTVELYGLLGRWEYAIYTDAHNPPQWVRCQREGNRAQLQLETQAHEITLIVFGEQVLEAKTEQGVVPCSGTAQEGYRLQLPGRAQVELRLA